MRILIHTKPADEVAHLVAERHPDAAVEICETYDGLRGMLESFRPEIVYSVRFLGGRNFPREALVENATVGWISVGGSGTDHLNPWDPDRVMVTNAAGVAAEMMAQYALGAMLSFSVGFPAFAEDKRQHRWNRSAFVEPITGKTVLIVGLGKTGEATAKISRAIGLTVLGVRARPRPTSDIDEVHGIEMLERLLPRADFVTVCVPLLPTTRGLLGANAFAAMKENAVLIDVSRGGVVDQPAVIAALQSGRIRGAALDVFETEPLPADNPLWDLPNVLITPHCSSVFRGWELRSATMFCDNLDRWRKGVPLRNVVDPQRGY